MDPGVTQGDHSTSVLKDRKGLKEFLEHCSRSRCVACWYQKYNKMCDNNFIFLLKKCISECVNNDKYYVQFCIFVLRYFLLLFVGTTSFV